MQVARFSTHRWCAHLAMLLVCVSTGLHAQASSKVRKPYVEEVVVELTAVVVALPQQASRWRSTSDERPAFYSWRVDANGGPGLSIVLAADTMMRGVNLTQIVGGSSLRKCEDPHNPSVHGCTMPLRDSVGVRDDFVQMILRDPRTLQYFREVRPATVRVTTFGPHGRFHLERFRVRYRDRVMRDGDG